MNFPFLGYFQGRLRLVAREENPIPDIFFPPFSLKAARFQIALDPRYQASEEFVQESLGPGEILQGAGLMKGSLRETNG